MPSCREGTLYEANPYAGAILRRPNDEVGSGALFAAVGAGSGRVGNCGADGCHHGAAWPVESIDVIRSIFFGLLITPWAVYFLSVVVEQLEESRQRLSRLVQKLEEMRERDLKLNVQLKDNIAQLNQEIVEREKAEAERQKRSSN